MDAAKYVDGGGYLSGNVLRQFRINEGYYDIDLETGEEVFLFDPRLENSTAQLLLPNCIIETTLGSQTHPAGEEHAMEIFDGQQWHTVILPEDVRHGNKLEFCVPATVASDRIIFNCGGEDGTFRYQVKLGQENWTMELFGKVP